MTKVSSESQHDFQYIDHRSEAEEDDEEDMEEEEVIYQPGYEGLSFITARLLCSWLRIS